MIILNTETHIIDYDLCTISSKSICSILITIHFDSPFTRTTKMQNVTSKKKEKKNSCLQFVHNSSGALVMYFDILKILHVKLSTNYWVHRKMIAEHLNISIFSYKFGFSALLCIQCCCFLLLFQFFFSIIIIFVCDKKKTTVDTQQNSRARLLYISTAKRLNGKW